MKTIINKEIKHLTTPAALIFLVCSLFAVWSNYSAVPRLVQGDRFNGAYVQTGSVNALVIDFVPLIAFFLGLYQCFSESSKGGTAFLIQRPVSLSRIFWSKVLVGVGAAIVTAGVPFIAQDSWRIYSNRFPSPAHWNFGEIAYCILFAPVAWFAASLVAHRPAKWWGSRLMPVVALIVAAEVSTNWLGWPVLDLLVFGAAAYGVFVGFGDSRRMGWISTASLAIINAVGGAVIALLVVALASTPFQDKRYDNEWTTLENGKFICVKSVNGRDISWSGLDGKVVIGQIGASRNMSPSWYSSDSSAVVCHDQQYSVYDTVDKVYKQYDLSTGRLVSVFDNSGFRTPTDSRPYDPIKDMGRKKDTIITSDAIYQVDFEHLKSHPVFRAEFGEKIMCFITSGYFVSQTAGYNDLMITTRRVITMSYYNKLISSWRSQIPMSSLAWYNSNISNSPPSNSAPSKLVLWFGKATNTGTMTAIVLNKGVETERHTLVNSEMVQVNPLYITHTSGLIMPFVLDQGVKIYSKYYDHNSTPSDRISDAFMAAGVALSLVLMLLIARRLEWGAWKTIIWSLAALLFGLLSIIAALSVYEWPAVLVCEKCGKKRLTTSAKCAHCGAAWSKAASDGVEIFEPGSYAASSVNLSSLKERKAEKTPIDALRVKRSPSLLRPLIAKELKILALPAILALIYGVAASIIVLLNLSGLNQWPNPSFANWIYSYSAIAALVFAVFQFGAEIRQGTAWSFFVHRPVSVGKQFGVKLCVGTLVYIVSVGGALLFDYFYANIPGHISGPFPKAGWTLALHDASFGMLFWLGAALVIVRPSRWYGSKLLPVVFCLGAAMVGHNCQSAAGYAAILLASYALIGTAAWGAIIGNGETSRFPRIARFTLGAVLAVSLVTLLGVSVLICEWEETPTNNQNNAPTITKILWRDPVENFMRFGNYNSNTPLWYLDKEKKASYCYDRDSYKLKGIVDGNGWRETSDVNAKIDPLVYSNEYIDARLLNPFLFYNGNTYTIAETTFLTGSRSVFLVNFDYPGSKAIFTANPDEKIQNAFQDQDVLLVETTKRIVLNDAFGSRKDIAVISKPENLIGVLMNSNVNLYTWKSPRVGVTEVTTDDIAKVFHSNHNSIPESAYFDFSGDNEQLHKQFEFSTNNTGRIKHITESPYNPTEPPTVVVEKDPLTTSFTSTLDWATLVIKGASHGAFQVQFGLWGIVLALVLTFIVCIRFGWSDLVIAKWVIGSLFLGVYTPLIVLSLYRWPQKLTCASCGKKRSVERDTCEHCGVHWAESVPTGAEIFEPMTTPCGRYVEEVESL